MTKKYYAGMNSYGTNFTYDGAWYVYRFDSSVERDAWVDADGYPRGNPTREKITRQTARHIVGSWAQIIQTNCPSWEAIAPSIVEIDSHAPNTIQNFWG